MSSEVKKYPTQKDFFWALSNPKFDANIKIKDSSGDVKSWKILKEVKTEYSNVFARAFAYGLSMFAPSESYESKEAFAKNLNQLVVANEPDFKKWGCKVDVIAKNLAKLREKVAQSAAPDDAKKLKDIFNVTIKAATKTVDADVAKAKAKAAADKAAADKAKFEATVKSFSENVPAGLKHEDQLSPEKFYNEFGRTAWVGLFGGFNKRINIIENNGRFELFTTPKLSFWQRLTGNRKTLLVSFEEKLAAVKELNKKVRADENYIKEKRFNVKAMATYLQGQLPKMCRNLTPTQAAQISKEVTATIADLTDYETAILEARSKDLSRRCGRGLAWAGKNLVLRPTVWTLDKTVAQPSIWAGKKVVSGTTTGIGYGARKVGAGITYGARAVGAGISYGAQAVNGLSREKKAYGTATLALFAGLAYVAFNNEAAYNAVFGA